MFRRRRDQPRRRRLEKLSLLVRNQGYTQTAEALNLRLTDRLLIGRSVILQPYPARANKLICSQRTAKPTTPPPQFAPPRPTTIQTAADGDGARLAPSIPQDPSQAPNKAKSVASDTRSDVIATQKARSHAPSVAPTTTTNVKHLVAESKFHDDTLCQLLDAARLNLIGTEAKRALHKAAKARVTELKELRVRGEVSLVSECV